MSRVAIAARGIAVMWLALPADVSGQSYRIRLDSRFQTVAYRGVALDSVLATDTVTGPTGGPVTGDGFAVSCLAGSAYCSYFRPGAVVRAAPITTTADVTMWGLGVSGLSVRAVGRVVGDLTGADRWPSTRPAAQLLEGYADLVRESFVAQLGRQIVETRFGYTGLDGARVTLRDSRRGLEATGYGGWGHAHGVALPVTSPALNPLDEFRPQDRQLVAGAGAGWSAARADLRLNYLREVDPRSDHFISERAGIDFVLRPLMGWTLTGGVDHDLAAGVWGSAEAKLRYAPRKGMVEASLGARRYRPHFELWTIWGAFSPVRYNAVEGSVWLTPNARLRLQARGEAYRFDDADAATPLVEYQTSGWRFAWGATYRHDARWLFDVGYHAEFGPGASSRGFDGAVTMVAADSLTLTAYASMLERPLEFRFSDAAVGAYGLNAEYRVTSRLHVQLDAGGYVESRDRPDAAAFDWNQVRVSTRVILLLGTSAELAGLPAAVRAMPDGRRPQRR